MSSTFKRTRKLSAPATNSDRAANSAESVVTSTSTASHVSTNQHLPMSGTKFWTHGIILTSTGLRELDNILLSSGTTTSSSSSNASTSSIGGQPMGTCICLETDDNFLPWASPLSNCIARYWCAECISQDQALVIPIFNESNKTSDINILSVMSSWSATSSDNDESPWNGFVTGSGTVTNMNIVQELLDSLPRNNNMDVQRRSELLKKDKSNPSTTAASNSAETWNMPLETLAEEGAYEHEGDDDEDEEYYNEHDDNATAPTKLSDTDAGLVVAWQYRKDIQDERLGFAQTGIHDSGKKRDQHQPSSAYCHSYNLQGRLKDQINVDSHVTMVPINAMNKSCSSNSRIRNGVEFYQQLISIITTATSKAASSRNTVVRLLLYHPNMSVTSFALPLLLHHIRTYKLPVIILMIPHSSSSISESSSTKSELYHIRRCSDVVMSTESFNLRDSNNYPPPSEFRSLHGLLHISRLSTMTQMCTLGHFAERTIQRSPISTRYGLYRDRRKLHISLLHIPPEDYSTDGGSVTNGAVRSGAGRSASSASNSGGCSSVGGAGPLDF